MVRHTMMMIATHSSLAPWLHTGKYTLQIGWHKMILIYDWFQQLLRERLSHWQQLPVSLCQVNIQFLLVELNYFYSESLFTISTILRPEQTSVIPGNTLFWLVDTKNTNLWLVDTEPVLMTSLSLMPTVLWTCFSRSLSSTTTRTRVRTAASTILYQWSLLSWVQTILFPVTLPQWLQSPVHLSTKAPGDTLFWLVETS